MVAADVISEKELKSCFVFQTVSLKLSSLNAKISFNKLMASLEVLVLSENIGHVSFRGYLSIAMELSIPTMGDIYFPIP